MTRFVCALACAVWAGAAGAQSVRLSGAEIGILLSGNTAVGTWEGTPYRQYFTPDGVTVFATDGARSARGEWRVQGDEYQSIWPSNTDWEGWFIMEYAGDWFWVSKTTPPTPFEMLEGEQLIAQ